MTAPISLDIHAHLIPVFTDRLTAFDGVSWDGERMTIDGHTVGIRSIYDPNQLLMWMDENQIAHAWVSAPPPTYRQHLQGRDAALWCRYLNDGLAEIAAAHSDRLTALPHLPTQDPRLCAEIIHRAKDQGVRRFSMPSSAGDQRSISDEVFDPLWKALNDVQAIVLIHPGEAADIRLKPFYLHNLLGNPYETAVAISHLVLGGVLERYAQITPIFAHGGGAYPMVAERLQRGFDTQRPGLDTEAQPPKSMLSRVHVDCICHGPRALSLAEQTFGQANVYFGSDWPLPMGLIDPHRHLADMPRHPATRGLHPNPAHPVPSG